MQFIADFYDTHNTFQFNIYETYINRISKPIKTPNLSELI
ncbi:hypothetical protein CEV34_1657 [Brucella pseudogrignonensis]|uniref:Uncharacterized protein n=1 Tax=Brucella pseudogrignonensis TaxID=419475 RepID=A0A256GLD5_9HYPH|nr:hypothetical protein CEV34_1657 [Brucella pseudogrignonensis]